MSTLTTDTVRDIRRVWFGLPLLTVLTLLLGILAAVTSMTH